MRNRRHVLKNLCWILILAIAAGFIVYGCAPQYAREEWRIVLNTAIHICTQCIGLG